MAKDTVIPVYRMIMGRHTDADGRRVKLPTPNNLRAIRLRNGIEELEGLPKKKNTEAMHDPQLCEWIKDQFHLEVSWYRFDTVQLRAIYSAVRVELWNKLAELEPVAGAERPLKGRKEDLELLPFADWFAAGNLPAFLKSRWKEAERD